MPTNGTNNWIIEGNGIQYMCGSHGRALHFTNGNGVKYFFKYKGEEIEIKNDADRLVLAFLEYADIDWLNKTFNVNVTEEQMKHAKQYYIWKKEICEKNVESTISYGEGIKTIIDGITSPNNDYIDTVNKTINMNEKTWKIKDFQAVKYIVTEKCKFDGSSSKGYIDKTEINLGLQPLIAYQCTLEEDGTDIKIIPYKTNEDGKQPLKGAKFELYKYNEKTKEYDPVKDSEKETVGNGYLEKPYQLDKNSTYKLKETQAPTYNGITYQISDQCVIIITDENGIKECRIEYEEDVKSVPEEEQQWEYKENQIVRLEDGITYKNLAVLQLKDKPQTKIKFYKTDKEGNVLANAKLEVYKIVDGKEEKIGPIYTTNDKGETEIILEEKNVTYRIKEKDGPDGFAPTNEYAEITIDKNGSIPEDGIKFYDKDGKDITDTTKLWKQGEETSTDSTEKQITLTLINEPTIKIMPKKINDKGEGLAGAIFNLFEIKSKLDQSMVSSSGVQGAIRTIEGGLGEKAYGLSKGRTYIIKEVQEPQGYKITENYGIIEVSEEGEITFTAYDKDGNVLSKDIDWEYKKEEGTDKDGIKYEGIIQLKDKPTTQIQIIKVNEDGNPITEDIAIFEVSGAGTLITSNNGESDKKAIDIKEKDTIEITESKEPNGYKKIEDKIVLKLQKDGEKVTGVNVQEGSKYATVEFNSEEDLIVVTIKNEKDDTKYKYELNILKTDADNQQPLPGVGFSITGNIENSGSFTTDSSGKIGPIKVNEIDSSKPEEYFITIKETSVPNEEYSLIEESIVIKIRVGENGTMSEPELISAVSGVTFEVQKEENENQDENEQKITMNLTIQNSKKIEDTKMPLLMYIKGQVWIDEPSGKNSEADGLYSSGKDKDLSGIIVTICEKGSTEPTPVAKSEDILTAIQGITVPDEVQEHIQKLQELEEKYGENTSVIETDNSGKFEFYGLDPSKEYTIKFTYNGMRFDECKVSTTAGLSGLNIEQENASRAIENSTERQNITKAFSEIGTYPYNYRSTSRGWYNKAYNQDQIEEALSGKSSIKLYKSDYAEIKALDEDMYHFIKDTLITATIDTEPILEYAENIIKAQNDSIDDKYGKFVYPEVQLQSYAGPNIDADGLYSSFELAKSDAENYIDEKTGQKKSVGWRISEIGFYEMKRMDIYLNCPECGYKASGYYKTGTARATISMTDYYKEEEHYKRLGGVSGSSYQGDRTHEHPHERTVYYHPKDENGDPIRDDKGNAVTATRKEKYFVYGYTNGFNITAKHTHSKYMLEIYEITDGYYTTNESHIRFANFNMDLEPYYNVIEVNRDDKGNTNIYDEYTQKKYEGISGLYETDWGWKEKGISALKVAKDLAKYVDYLNRDKITELEDWSEIEKILNEKLTEDEVKGILKKKFLEHENLGVLYRPTVDLGLYNDVLKAYLKTGTAQKEETYIYDKRASNGGAFKFGVNEYDINRPTDVETAYAQYYSNLSNGQTTNNSSQQPDFEYTDLRQKEDVFPDAQQESNGIGEAIASGFDPCPVTIELTYKIRVINQAETEAMATEIVDYYDSAFEFIGAYEDPELTREISTSDTSIYQGRGPKAAAPAGYQTKYIQLNKWLKNNDSTDIYIKVSMVNPRATLNGYLEPGGEGYKTLNYAEINGYMTHIGVIDIDSMPGNIVDDGKGRFPNGQYEDDESKSPTYIIRNPGNKTRIIEGNLFEDFTGEDDVRAYTEETRKGDGLLSNDTPISGGVVELVELDDNGNEVKNSNGSEIRGAPLTDSNGHYIIKNIPAGNYLVRFRYGSNNETVLLKNYNGGENNKSYNGQDYESTLTEYKYASGKKYWYVDGIEGQRWSDAIDIQARRNEVNEKSKTLTNHIAEVFNSYKDKQPNMNLVEELKNDYQMYAETAMMSMEIENIMKYGKNEYGEYEVKDAGNKTVADYEYDVKNIDFGIVERERAELQITKKVSYISIVDSTGKEITGGTVEDIQAGKVNYIKMLPNEYDKYGNVDKKGFADMEIDKELLSGALLKIKYEMTVTNKSETSEDDRNPNTITDIQIIDYVSNNLTYNDKYAENRNSNWTPKKVDDITPYLNSTSITTEDETNKIHLKEYQTILQTSIDSLAPGEKETKMLVLEKNLSSEEDSNFNYENQVEIVQSRNEKGRGDYSSIYGNLDPLTYTSRQGNLKWDEITDRKQNAEHGFAQKLTTDADDIRANSIREAEKDSGNAEEVIITPPTGTKGIVFQTQHYIIAIIGLISIAGIAVLMKKNLKK